MEFMNWCERLPAIILHERQINPRAKIFGMRIERIEELMFGSAAERFRNYSIDRVERESFFTGIKDFSRLKLIECVSPQGLTYNVTPAGEKFTLDRSAVWREICSLVIDPDEQKLLQLINRLSPEQADGYALVRWIRESILRAELGWPDKGEDDYLRATTVSLDNRGFVHSAVRNFSPGPEGSDYELVIHASYLGLAWETHAKRVQDISRLDREEIRKSMWLLECDHSCKQGTAFNLVGVGTVTCNHVLGPDTKAFRPNDPTKKYPVAVINQNEDLDLAIIAIGTREYSVDSGLPRGASDQVQEGDAIAVAGFPNYRFGDTGTIVEGRIVGFRVVHGIHRMLVDAPIVAGSSGGPVLNNEGRVVGIAVTGADAMELVLDTEKHGVIPIEALKYLTPGN